MVTRRQAREIAVQSLYWIEMNEVSAEEAVHSVMEQLRELEEKDLKEDDKTLAFILALVKGVRERLDSIDEWISRSLRGWKLDRLSRVDKQILRMAVFEMIYYDETPPIVAVNEAVELAKAFGDEQSGKFVNGVLGKILQDREEVKK